MIPSRTSPVIQMNRTGPAGQLRPVALLKAAELLGTILFGVLAPRMMGPNLFGEFAVIFSVSGLWRTASTLGGRYVFGRFIPDYVSREETARVRAVFMHVLGSRLFVVLLAAPALFVFLRRLLPGASLATLLASVGAFVAMTAASPMYNVFFGLNRLGTSMTHQAFGRFLLLILLVVVGGATSLERASFAWLATQLCVLGVGFGLSRHLFTLDRSAFHLPSLSEHVGFGLAVFAANLLLRIPWRLGETALAMGGVDASEIAFFNIAILATIAFTRLVGGATTLLIPSLSLRQVAGDQKGRDRSLGLALKYLTVAACLFVLVVLAVAPWAVRVLLGATYLGVLPNLFIVAAAAVPVPVIRTALSLAVVRSRVRLNAQLGATAVLVFGLSALLLIPRYASQGASAALVLAILSTAIVALFQLRGTEVLAVARARHQVLAATGPAALLLLAGTAPIVAVSAAGIYVALLFALHIISWKELRLLLEPGRRSRAAQPAPVSPPDL